MPKSYGSVVSCLGFIFRTELMADEVPEPVTELGTERNRTAERLDSSDSGCDICAGTPCIFCDCYCGMG